MKIALIGRLINSLRPTRIIGQMLMTCSGSKIGKIAGDENDSDC
jgi:hypothetical protein